MRPSIRATAAASLLAIPLLAASAAAAPTAKGNGKGHPSPPVVNTYTGVGRQAGCASGYDTCTAEGSADATTGFVQGSAGFTRTAPTTGTDDAYSLPYYGKYFNLSSTAHTITANVHFSGITMDPANHVSSSTGHIVGSTFVGAEIYDEACAPRTCNATHGRVDVVTQVKDVVAGQDVPATADNSSPAQTLTVTLAMPDGSALPSGRISIAGWVQARATSWPLGCAIDSSCPGGPPHTGDAQLATSATISAIDWTIA